QHASSVLAFVSYDTGFDDRATGNEIFYSGGRAGPGVFISGNPSGSTYLRNLGGEHPDSDAPITLGAANGYWLSVAGELRQVQLRRAYDNAVLTVYGTFGDFGINMDDYSMQLPLKINARIEPAQTVIEAWVNDVLQPTYVDTSGYRVSSAGGV